MSKVAIIVAPGFEEGETITIVDILRRAHIVCHTFGFTKEVEGGHNINIVCDYKLNDDILNYNMVIIPGGMPGAVNLANNKKVIEVLQYFNNNNKYIASICAAARALDAAGILKNKKYTSFTGYGDILNDGEYLEEIIVHDDKLITSRAPGTTYAFAYYLVDILGKESIKLKEDMHYFNAFKEDVK